MTYLWPMRAMATGITLAVHADKNREDHEMYFNFLWHDQMVVKSRKK